MYGIYAGIPIATGTVAIGRLGNARKLRSDVSMGTESVRTSIKTFHARQQHTTFRERTLECRIGC